MSEDKDVLNRLAGLESGHQEIRQKIESLERVDTVILQDIAQLKAALGQTATKADVADARVALSGEIHKAINGILRDALSAVPMKQQALWALLTGLIAAGALGVSLWHH